MLRIVVVRRRGWHCCFTKACAFEQLGPGFRLAGTNMTFCGSHVRMADMMSHSGGRDGGELTAKMNLTPKRTGAA
jgi:hypothetical protein